MREQGSIWVIFSCKSFCVRRAGNQCKQKNVNKLLNCVQRAIKSCNWELMQDTSKWKAISCNLRNRLNDIY